MAIRALSPTPRAPSSNDAQRHVRPLGERVLYNAYCACFVLAPFVGMWIAFATLHRDSSQVASLLYGSFWLLWGLVPAFIAAMRRPSTLDSFKAKVEHYAGGSFRYLAWLWALCVCLASLNAARLFFRT
jgi:hypothetical protein